MNSFFLLLRLRTLPLALAVIFCGNALAYRDGHWGLLVLLLSLATALGLQMLSNVANDYGDGIRGTDEHRRERLTAQGTVSRRTMRLLIAALALGSFCIGVCLIHVSLQTPLQKLSFLAAGILSIIAAMTYTLGRHAYGYVGLGEAAVFVFFGYVGVLGSYCLHHMPPSAAHFLPATAIGLLCAAVLNVNNLRDIDGDRRVGKNTLAVRLGFVRAKRLHQSMLAAAALFLAFYGVWQAHGSLLWVLLLPLLWRHAGRIRRASDSADCAAELKPVVLLTFGISLLFSLGLLLG